MASFSLFLSGDGSSLADEAAGRIGVAEPRFRGPRVVATSPSQGELGKFEGDFDHDGRLDLLLLGSVLLRPGVTANASFVFLNQGRGRLSQAKTTVLDRGPDNTVVGLVTPGDFDSDGTPDLIGVFVQFTPFLKNLVFYRGNGDGTFAPPVVASPPLTPDDASHPLVVGDVTEDSRVDVIAQFQDKISVLSGNGDGTFGAPIDSGFSEAGHSETLIADFTGDGHRDLVISVITGGSNFSSADVYLQVGNGDGTFQSIQKQTVDTNLTTGLTEDFDGDGLPDAAFIGDGGSNGGRAGLWVFLNEGGTLGPGTYYPRGQGGIGSADLNLDGAVDIVTSDLLISLNDGAGRFDQVVNIPGNDGIAAVGDFTQDQKPDIVSVVGSEPFSIETFVNATPGM
jgi:FG-GAP-like repeat